MTPPQYFVSTRPPRETSDARHRTTLLHHFSSASHHFTAKWTYGAPHAPAALLLGESHRPTGAQRMVCRNHSHTTSKSPTPCTLPVSTSSTHIKTVANDSIGKFARSTSQPSTPSSSGWQAHRACTSSITKHHCRTTQTPCRAS